MKQFKEYIFEAWGTNRRYDYEKQLKELLSKYNDKKVKAEKSSNKPSRRYGMMRNPSRPSDILSKYPMEILVNKMGYEPKTIIKHSYSRKGPSDKQVIDLKAYGEWLAGQIENGKITSDQLIDWWQEYDSDVNKANWHSVDWLVKNIDPDRLWIIYNPKNDVNFNSILEHPERICNYLKVSKYRLSTEEQEDFISYFTDPVNAEELKKMIKSSETKLKKLKPSYTKSAENVIQSVLDNVKVDGKHFNYKEVLANKQKPKTYYQGANEESFYDAAVYSTIMKALKETFGVEFYDYPEYEEDTDYDGNKIKNYIGTKFSLSSSQEENAEKFVDAYNDDFNYLNIEVNDLGSSEDSGKSSGVHSSSFHVSYKHDFNVKITLGEKVLFDKKFEGVTVASYFYSGGWN